MIVLLAALSGCKEPNKPNPIDCPPGYHLGGIDATECILDTTSHEFTWEIDTIGTWQSYLDDVWGTSETDVYAVGLIYEGGIALSNVLHYDGNSWAQMDYLKGWIQALHGRGKDNVWIVGESHLDTKRHPLIGHWNGSSWESWELTNYEGSLRTVWCSPSGDVYAGGNDGFLFKYDGTQWSWEYIINDYLHNHHIVDIWGVSRSSIYAVGGTYSTGEGAMFHFDGSEWNKIYEDLYTPNTRSGFVSTLWGESDTTLYVSFAGGEYFGGLDIFQRLNPLTDNTFIEKIRGASANDIFMVGHFGLITHWNGDSWYRWDEYYKEPEDPVFTGVWNNDSDVFIVGYTEDSRAIIFHGRRTYP